jgi:hypothetical protein
LEKSNGFTLWSQQVHALLFKRFHVFFKRYVLAVIMLASPALLELIGTMLIPSQTYMIAQLSGKSKHPGARIISALDYVPTSMPIAYSNTTTNATQLTTAVSAFYSSPSRAGLRLIELHPPNTNNLSQWVLEQRKNDPKKLIGDLYFGMTLHTGGLTTPVKGSLESQLQATLFYSTMAFHSSATIVNELSNLLLSLVIDYDQENTSSGLVGGKFSIQFNLESNLSLSLLYNKLSFFYYKLLYGYIFS